MDFDQLLHEADPVRDIALPGADSPAAQTAYERVVAFTPTGRRRHVGSPHSRRLTQGAVVSLTAGLVSGRLRPRIHSAGLWRPGRAHRRLIILGVALPVLLGATAAGWTIAASSPVIRNTPVVECANSAQLQAGGYITMSQGASPTALCARAWASGLVTTGHPVRHVPRLVACVLPASRNPDEIGIGRVGVFPGTTCAALHLPPLPAGYDQAARQMAGLDGYLRAGSNAQCDNVTAADAFARGALARFGLAGWTITHPEGMHSRAASGPQCWNAQADGAAHAIQVLPIPAKAHQ